MKTLLAVLALLIAAPAFAETPVTLRARIEAHGPAVTLGDLFQDAGEVSARAIAPAPSPGQVTSLPVSFVAAAAQSAGLAWTPPAGVTQIRVVRPGGARAFLAADAPAQTDIAVRRGETVQLVYAAPGLQLTTRARALGNGAVGDAIRLVNLQSSRTIEAVVTGPGTATAAPY